MNTKPTPKRTAWPLRCLLFIAVVSTGSIASADEVKRGKYLVTIMDCGGCHTTGSLAGRPDGSRILAGSEVGFGGPDGIVYPPNLTPDPESGLGNWSNEDVAKAIRYGTRPDGRVLSPAMPWPNYSFLTDEDVGAIVAYLRTVTPVRFKVPGPVPAGQPAPGPYLNLVTG